MTTQSLEAKITAALESAKEQYNTLSAAHETGFSPAELPKLEKALAEFERNRLFELDDGRRIDLGDLLVLRDFARENQIELERLLARRRVTIDAKGRMEGLDFAYLGLTTLNLSGLTALTYLEVSYNQLTSLDLSNNTALIELNASNNQLTSLDLSRNTALTHLYASNNQLTSLDLSRNTKLNWLDASNNQHLSTLTLPASGQRLSGSVWQTKIPRSKVKELEALGMWTS